MQVAVNFDGIAFPQTFGTAAFGWVVLGAPGRTRPATGAGAMTRPGATEHLAAYAGLIHALVWLRDSGSIDRDDLVVLRSANWLVLHQVALDCGCKVAAHAVARDACRSLLREIGCGWEVKWVSRELLVQADGLARVAWANATGGTFHERRPRR
jgi:ribonuclease HI